MTNKQIARCEEVHFRENEREREWSAEDIRLVEERRYKEVVEEVVKNCEVKEEVPL